MEFSIIVVGIQYVAIAIMTIIGLYALRQRPSELQKYVVLLMLSTMLMFVGYNIELAASNITEAIAGVGVSYIGKPFIMLTSFLFIARFYNISVDKRLVNFLIALSIAFPLLVTTNNYHHLYYATVNWDPQQDFSHLVLTRGPCYYLYILCAVLFFVVCVYIAILGYKRSQLKHKKAHFGFIVGMVFSGILGYGIYLTGITGGYDATIVGVFVGTIFLALLFTRAKMVDIVTLAKDQALDDSMVGLVVFDTNGKIAYKNSGMKHIIEEGFNIEKLKKMEVGSEEFSVGEKRYKFNKRYLELNEDKLGKAVEAYDVTDSYFYQRRLEKEVKERTAEIEKMQRNVIASVAGIVEARSFETGEHVKRTSHYVEITAKTLQHMGLYRDILTDEYIDTIAIAAPLHDIGKIAVPDAILMKPAKLTEEEFEVMKTHTTSGAQIIEESIRGIESDEYVDTARDVAHFHHERWDGTGYPTGLKGNDIPLCARIMAVADCYDAISSKRCYKEAASKEETLSIIRTESGTHFDPTVVHAFIDAIEKEE